MITILLHQRIPSMAVLWLLLMIVALLLVGVFLNRNMGRGKRKKRT